MNCGMCDVRIDHGEKHEPWCDTPHAFLERLLDNAEARATEPKYDLVAFATWLQFGANRQSKGLSG